MIDRQLNPAARLWPRDINLCNRLTLGHANLHQTRWRTIQVPYQSTKSPNLARAIEGLDGLVNRLQEDPPNWFQRTAYDWIRVPVPVIAAIHGACFGGGLQIALAADIRICAPDARLSVMEIRWGLIPDMSITRTLPRLVGIDVAKELTYTGRMLSGSEAHALGLVTSVADDPLAAARSLAAEVAGRSPDAIRAAKRLYDEAWTGAPEETLALEASAQRRLIGSQNQIAAVTAGMTKQPAEFADPEPARTS